MTRATTPRSTGRRVPVATIVTALVLAAVYAYEALRFGWSLTPPALHLMGAVSRGSVETGNWWSPIATNLLHVHWAHAALVIVGVLVLGWVVERTYGSGVFVAIVLAGAAASTGYSLVTDSDAGVVGFDGAVAALAVFGASAGSRTLSAPRRERGGDVAMLAFILVVALQVPSVALRPADRVESIGAYTTLAGALAGAVLVVVQHLGGMRVVGRVALPIGVALLVAVAIGATPMAIGSTPANWQGVGSDDAPDPSPNLVERMLRGTNVEDIGLVRSAHCQDRDDHVVECRFNGDDERPWTLYRVRADPLRIELVRPVSRRATERELAEDYDEAPDCTDTTERSDRIEGRRRYECVGYIDDLQSRITVSYDEFGEAEYEESPVTLATELLRSRGIDIGSSTARFQSPTCTEATPETASCTATYLGRGYFVAVDVLAPDWGDSISLAPKERYRAAPTVSAEAERVALAVTYDLSDEAGTSRATAANCTTSGDRFRTWDCQLTFDDGTRDVLQFHYDGKGSAYTSRGPDDVYDPAARHKEFWGKVPPFDHGAFGSEARRTMAVAPAKAEMLLRGRTFRTGAGAAAGVAKVVRCDEMEVGTVDPDFLCTIEFDDGEEGEFEVDVMPPGIAYATPLDLREIEDGRELAPVR